MLASYLMFYCCCLFCLLSLTYAVAWSGKSIPFFIINKTAAPCLLFNFNLTFFGRVCLPVSATTCTSITRCANVVVHELCRDISTCQVAIWNYFSMSRLRISASKK